MQSVNLDTTFYNKQLIQRVRAVNAKDRVRNRTQVYHRGEVIYADNTFLHFFLDIQPEYLSSFRESINYIVDYAGIGGEINIGFSEINDSEITPFKLPTTDNPDKYYLMSLLTLSQNINYKESFYDVINKKSWFNSPFHHYQLKKRTLKMLTEGSCLSCSNIKGSLVDVTPAVEENWENDSRWHPIYRNGIGYGFGY